MRHSLLFAPRLRKGFRQAHNIPQAKVEPLPRDGVQRLSGITDKRQTMGDGLRGSSQRKRVNRPLSSMGNTPQPPAKGFLQLGTKTFV